MNTDEYTCSRRRPPKFTLVKQQIRNAIIRGELKPAEQLPAFPEVARRFGVTGPTAKRAIDELVRDRWLRSKRGVGTFVHVHKSSSFVVLTAPRSRSYEPFLSPETIEEFHSKRPNVRVLHTAEPSTDLIVTDSYDLVADRLREQKLQSLDDLQSRLHHVPWKLSPMARQLAEWQGVLYGLPLRFDLTALQFNPKIIQEVGMQMPGQYADGDFIQEVLRRCCRDTDGDGVHDHFGTFGRLDLSEWLIPFWQRGGRLDQRVAFFDSAALGVLDDLWRCYHVERTLPFELPPAQGEFTNKLTRERFRNGQVAMLRVTTRDIFREYAFPTRVALPNFGHVRRQMAAATVVGIHRECPHPEAALDFLDFCHRRFIAENEGYPLALNETERHLLRAQPAVRDLLLEGLEAASEPLHEGIPERTWAIENEIFQWYRMFQTRTSLMTRLREHWDRWNPAMTEAVDSEPKHA
ncbi:MAG: GntR family transcriptional regulator [Verrucomicrobia bacterium]|nr:GntR family transcriptional regulator [Verrucomicrobiota bacterium]